jgi:hypothetical protein
VEWAAWAAWVEWECNPTLSKQKFKKGSLYCPFFMSALKIFNEGYNEVSTKSSFP